MDAKKLYLFNQIKSFSMPDFPNLHVLSKSFFNDLILKSYQNKGMYTILYGDINGLRKLNDEIGFRNADLAIEELLKTILSCLPENTISSRVGGDEFCFIVPDLSTNQTREITKNIHSNLLSNPKVKGLDITFGACDSNNFDNIRDMYSFVENKVNLKKHTNLHLDENVNSLEEYNERLDEFIDSTIKTYIKNFRFTSKRYFTGEDIKTLSYPILYAITNLLNNKSIDIKHITNNEELGSETPAIVNPETFENLYHLITSEDIDFEALSQISDDDLEYIKNRLSIDPITNAYNGVYRDHYLLEELETENVPFQIILVQTPGMKISNSVFTHAGSDLKINYTFNNLFNEINSLIPEDSNIDIIPIHSGGGTFEFIVKNNTDIINDDILQNILDKMGLDPKNFRILGILGNCSNVSEYDEVYSKLDKICEFKKNKIKNQSEYFINPIALQLIDVSLASLVNFFKTQSQNLGMYNEQEKIAFTKKIISSLINNFNELNFANAEFEKKKSDIQIDER